MVGTQRHYFVVWGWGLLLVVFIVTAPLMTRAIHVELPETVASAPVDDMQHVHISMDAEGIPYIDNRRVTLELLEAELRTLHDVNPDLTVRVDGDQNTPYGQMALMMSLIQRAGVSKIDMVTLPTEL